MTSFSGPNANTPAGIVEDFVLQFQSGSPVVDVGACGLQSIDDIYCPHTLGTKSADLLGIPLYTVSLDFERMTGLLNSLSIADASVNCSDGPGLMVSTPLVVEALITASISNVSVELQVRAEVAGTTSTEALTLTDVALNLSV